MRKKPIGSQIHILANMIHRFVESLPNKKQIDSLTGTNAWIIGYIASRRGEDVFQKDFEKQFGITRSTASKVVNLMEKKGLVERRSVPNDARLKKLVLTEKSEKIHRLMIEDFKKLESTLEKGFSEEELERFDEYVHRMQRNLEDASKEYRSETGGNCI